MFQRQHLTRLTLAAALLSAAVITLPAQAGLLGGGASRGLSGSLAGAGAAGGMGSLGARSLELNGQGAGRADAEASGPAIGRPLRDTLTRSQERAGKLGNGINDAQERTSGRAAGQAEGAGALAVDRANGGMGRVDGSGASSAGQAGAAGAAGGLLSATRQTADTQPANPSAAEGPGAQAAPPNTARSLASGSQNTGAALGMGRADTGADSSGQAQASRNGNRVEASGSASAQTSAQASARR